MTSVTDKEALAILYYQLKASKLGDLADLREECELLDLKVSDALLIELQEIAISTSSLEEAKAQLNLVGRAGSVLMQKHEDQGSKPVVKQAASLVDEKKGVAATGVTSQVAQVVGERSKVESKEQKKQSMNMARDMNFHEHISDFKILSSKSRSDLEKQVLMGMTNGWKPFGSIAVYNPGGKLGGVPDSFFQTVVKFSYDE